MSERALNDRAHFLFVMLAGESEIIMSREGRSERGELVQVPGKTNPLNEPHGRGGGRQLTTRSRAPATAGAKIPAPLRHDTIVGRLAGLDRLQRLAKRMVEFLMLRHPAAQNRFKVGQISD